MSVCVHGLMRICLFFCVYVVCVYLSITSMTVDHLNMTTKSQALKVTIQIQDCWLNQGVSC